MNLNLSIKSIVGIVFVMLFLNIKTNAQIPACSTYVFTTSSETYTYLSGGNSASTIHCDDCNLTNIPIGFTFPFCGNNYTTVTASSNGFISFVNTTNSSLTNAQTSMTGISPMLQIMWDDMWGTTGATASYLTTGTAPNRVFTFEWRNWRTFANSGSGAAISMQMRLYETSGRIQMVYNRESASSLYVPPGATIGIAAPGTLDWQTLPNTGTTPVPSSTVFTTSIASWPASGQVYQWDPPTPCTKASAFTMLNVNSQAASFSWTGVTGALDYQYAVDTRADLAPNVATTITTTSATNGSVTGLLPSTTYYLHVRTRCAVTSISQWDTLSFRTLPECSKPNKIIIAYVDSNSAQFQWPAVGTATSYQYIVGPAKITPKGNIAISTTNTFVPLTGLTEGTWYYVYYRSLCPNIDSSAWMLDSFYTPTPCRKPILQVSYLSPNNSVISWSPVKTAVSYEYFFGKTAPALGTPILFTSVQTPYLQPNTGYTVYVRCNCSDNNIKTSSGWSSIDFTSNPPTSVNGSVGSINAINVYPNPAKDRIVIENNNGFVNGSMIEVLDITGKKVITATTQSGRILELDVRHLSAGMYMLRLKNDDITQTIRFDKQ